MSPVDRPGNHEPESHERVGIPTPEEAEAKIRGGIDGRKEWLDAAFDDVRSGDYRRIDPGLRLGEGALSLNGMGSVRVVEIDDNVDPVVYTRGDREVWYSPGLDGTVELKTEQRRQDATQLFGDSFVGGNIFARGSHGAPMDTVVFAPSRLPLRFASLGENESVALGNRAGAVALDGLSRNATVTGEKIDTLVMDSVGGQADVAFKGVRNTMIGDKTPWGMGGDANAMIVEAQTVSGGLAGNSHLYVARLDPMFGQIVTSPAAERVGGRGSQAWRIRSPRDIEV